MEAGRTIGGTGPMTRSGRGSMRWPHPGAGYRAVTRAAVRAAAERYLSPQSRFEGVVRGAVAG